MNDNINTWVDSLPDEAKELVKKETEKAFPYEPNMSVLIKK